MLLTSKDANKMLKQLNEELSSLQRNEDNSMRFVAATIENKEDVRPDYDYKDMRKKMDELERKIIRLKHAINLFNTRTIVPGFDMTIDEMLIYIPQLYAKKLKLSHMKDYPKMERTLQQYSTNLINYTYINFDTDEVQEDYRKTDDELSKAQIALDKINVSETFEVEV